MYISPSQLLVRRRTQQVAAVFARPYWHVHPVFWSLLAVSLKEISEEFEPPLPDGR